MRASVIKFNGPSRLRGAREDPLHGHVSAESHTNICETASVLHSHKMNLTMLNYDEMSIDRLSLYPRDAPFRESPEAATSKPEPPAAQPTHSNNSHRQHTNDHQNNTPYRLDDKYDPIQVRGYRN